MSELGTALFERIYLQVRDYLNWQNARKKNRIPLPEDVEKLTYAYSDSLSHIRQCNLYRPRNMEHPENLPLIIDIHGGGWIYGDKDVYDEYSSQLALQGYNISSLTYRTIDQVNMKEQIQDIFAYLHFLEEHKDELKIPLDQVMLTGDSAGAQLSLLCYSINKSEKLQKIFGVKPVNIDISCMVLTHPVCFIDQAGKIPRSQWISEVLTVPGLQTMIYGKHFEAQDVYRHSVNPNAYVSEDIDYPPILLVTSQGDILFKYQTFMLADFFNRMNIDFELFLEENPRAAHVYNVSNPSHDLSEKCNQVMLDFFEKARENGKAVNDQKEKENV